MKKHALAIAMTAITAGAAAQTNNYPQAPRDNTKDVYFGVEVADPYRPLENDTSAETAAWVEAENRVTNAHLAKIPQRKKILKRLKEVGNYEKVGVPFEKHGKWYQYRNDGLQNQSILYVSDKLGEAGRVFLDPNKLSDDGTVALKGTSFSKDGRYMAYVISRSGSDWEEIYVRDVETGKDLSDHIVWAKFTDAAWRGDGFYYSAYDAPTAGKELSNVNSVQKIYYHKIGTPQSEDILFYHNPVNPLRFYNVSLNDDETMMFLTEGGDGTGNTLYVRDLRKTDSQFTQITNDKDKFYSPIETIGDSILIITNDGAPRCRIMVANIANPGRNEWEELVAERPEVLDGVTFAADKMLLSYTKDACSSASLHGLDGKHIRDIELPGVGTASFHGQKGKSECFFSFTSFTVPSAVYRYDLASGATSLQSAPKVNFKMDDFTSELVFVTSKDGTKVPLFLTYKKGMKRNGKNAVYLYGYGGFAVTLTPSFSWTIIPFLESGGIYAQACLRGGYEYGEEWHLAGTKMRKQNVFDDFIASAEWLIANQYTDNEHLAIAGGSNGGLLVGACMTQRPDLFKVCIPRVGVMDMLRYHKFTIGWNWASDYGTSEDSREMFEYLRAYSPLHALKPGTKYPATLVTTADHDDRVVPAHSFKFAARLQECQAGDAPALIRIDSKAGHGAGKPLSKVMEEMADIYGFVMYHTGMKVK